ncbi:TGF-beta-activated kinase 1 and MAP3K7-binding protein 2-like [Varroa jacobsoni]|uniref:RanBP2-type domain-containing protein n=1 Tax=Varroa destructor TaxID=109461 RepID=A0A7M7JGC5_VARDE|nr:TGF-beta-activated kinase 1 and MAP3K7-binding protein 2-like isoform X3 [Varroa destructor]XP_022705253.1 TGF-beta-activated kinase 1 and MAP3K7-binding protein 2-like [Varroa jacobsoni]
MDSREGLLTEMLHRFSELPAETVQAHVNLYPRNRDALISELTRVLSLSRASPGYTDSIEGGEMLYSNFEASMGVEGSELGSLPLPEPPPSLVITPPTSPEKTVDKFTNTTSHAGSGNNGDTLSYVPALSIARGASGIINDLGYEEFLLQNQRQRLKALEEAYKRNETCLANLRREVLAKERFLFEETLITNFDNNVNNNNVNITIDTLLELTQANRQLSVQNHCLITEVDLQTDGCAPLGDVTRHAFYDQIYPGPRDPLVEIDSRTPSRNPTVSNTIVNPPSAGNGTMNGDEEDDDVNDADRWVCQACTLKNHPEIIFCEACFSPKPVAQPATSCSSKIGGGNNQQKPDSASPSRSTDDVNSSVPTVNNTMNVTGSNHSNNSNN